MPGPVHPGPAYHLLVLLACCQATLLMGPLPEAAAWGSSEKVRTVCPGEAALAVGLLLARWAFSGPGWRPTHVLSLLLSSPVCHHLRERDDHFPADVRQHQPVPWDAQQRSGLPEALPGAKGLEWASHGLYCFHLVHVQRHRHREGKEGHDLRWALCVSFPRENGGTPAGRGVLKPGWGLGSWVPKSYPQKFSVWLCSRTSN